MSNDRALQVRVRLADGRTQETTIPIASIGRIGWGRSNGELTAYIRPASRDFADLVVKDPASLGAIARYYNIDLDQVAREKETK